MTRRSLPTLPGSVLAVAAPAHAVPVRGGGSLANDCLLVFEAPANSPAAKPKHVRCTDGDACDADGVVNGSCEFAVGVCANSTLVPGCTSNGVQSVTVAHAADNGDRKFDPEFQALQTRINGSVDPPFASGALDEARFDALATALARLCACSVVDDSRLVSAAPGSEASSRRAYTPTGRP